MATIIDKPETTTESSAPEKAPAKVLKQGRGRRVLGAIALAAVAGVAGWQAPNAIAAMTKPAYLGADASAVASKIGCTGYQRATKHDDTVYTYRDQGTCAINGVVVTITTFDEVTDGEAFAAVMEAVIPVLHPTWSGATYAAGEGWNVADARNLTPEIADLAVTRLAEGATHVIRSGS